MKNFIQEGDKLTLPAPADLASGDGAHIGALFGVAEHAALTGESVTLVMRGVASLPKDGAEVWAVGAPIYWSAGLATTTAAGALIGAASEAAVATSTAGAVRFDGTAVAVV